MGYLQFVDYGSSDAPLRVVSLHGFPSIRSVQNRELAANISKELSCRVRVVLYPGLSCPGVFSFKKAIKAMLEEFPALVDSDGVSSKIDLLGHSFGGFCAILLASKFPTLVRRMTLLSPLLRFSASPPEVTHFFNTLLSTSSGIDTLSSQELAGEFYDLAKEYQVENLIAKLAPDLEVKFMQARKDTITPTTTAEQFRHYFKCKFAFELVDQDHSFLSDRSALSHEIAAFFGST